MRLTRETLIKIARETAGQRARVSRRIICIYLTGSVLEESPLLGGTTDIDLIIVHDDEPLQPREIVRLSDEVHLDIGHYAQEKFHHPRHLRSDPWLGPFIYSKPMVLFDTQHWFDFAQAATGAQFFQPDYVLQRSMKLAQTARQSWMDLNSNGSGNHNRSIYGMLKTMENAGNALVCLTGEGKPLTDRRFILQLPQRLQSFNQPDLFSGLVSLFLPDPGQLESIWPKMLDSWKASFHISSSQANIPPQLLPCRQVYYEHAAAALWQNSPSAALWPILLSWAQSAIYLPEDAPVLSEWLSTCQTLGLDAEHFSERLQAVDRYLDRVEETIDNWSRANGVSDIDGF